MSGSITIPLEEVIPSRGDVLARQGRSTTAPVREAVRELIDRSIGIFLGDARPRCVAAEISAGDFGDVFRGDGFNDPEAPLAEIYPRADRLVLFALTMGEGVGGKITDFFKTNDFAVGSVLDTVASLAVERSVAHLEDRVAADRGGGEDGTSDGNAVLNYSPGYCGWHLSAQKQIFRYLRPGRIGMSLNESFLMTPLKSATGVLVSGKASIHHFDNDFGFCRTCREKTCVERRERFTGADQ
jgi:hypothetical protein